MHGPSSGFAFDGQPVVWVSSNIAVLIKVITWVGDWTDSGDLGGGICSLPRESHSCTGSAMEALGCQSGEPLRSSSLPWLPFSLHDAHSGTATARYRRAWPSERLGKRLTRRRGQRSNARYIAAIKPGRSQFRLVTPGREGCFSVQALESAGKAWPRVNLAAQGHDRGATGARQGLGGGRRRARRSLAGAATRGSAVYRRLISCFPPSSPV